MLCLQCKISALDNTLSHAKPKPTEGSGQVLQAELRYRIKEFDVGTDGMLWCRYCNYVSKRGFNMRRHYQRNHLGLLAPRLVSRAELVLLPPVSEGSHRGWILP
ncbi:uncharacterized protein LOC115319380 isoform X4 [Ixodes scapularis]|uniref:uncharacterized protein LOC115319380 isoform X4 n=1 Tax=Ixodes scapularis TaxID=6945 RepID=UPI001C39152F|nr:uncharacterized protein LOC115319380 isoform X4 [Ixodes scapularis]